MNSKSTPYRVHSIVEDIEKREGQHRKLYLDFTNQRPERQWSRETQSLLIHTILQEEIIPEIYITKTEIPKVRPRTVIDGKQRLSTIYDYYRDGFRLSKKTPNVKIAVPVRDENGDVVKNEFGQIQYKKEEFVIAGKKFSKLPEQLKVNFGDYELTSREISDFNEKELLSLMYRLNNGKPLNGTQKAVTSLNVALSEKITQIAQSKFFENRIKLTESKRKNDENKKTVLTALMLYTEELYSTINGTSLKNFVDKMNMAIETTIGADYDEAVETTGYYFDILDDLLPSLTDENDDINILISNRFSTTATIAPTVFMNIVKYNEMADNGEITEDVYREFLKYWFIEGITDELYTQYSETKSVNARRNVEGRIAIMDFALEQFAAGFKLSDIDESVREKMLSHDEEYEDCDDEDAEENNNNETNANEAVNSTDTPDITRANGVESAFNNIFDNVCIAEDMGVTEGADNLMHDVVNDNTNNDSNINTNADTNVDSVNDNNIIGDNIVNDGSNNSDDSDVIIDNTVVAESDNEKNNNDYNNDVASALNDLFSHFDNDDTVAYACMSRLIKENPYMDSLTKVDTDKFAEWFGSNISEKNQLRYIKNTIRIKECMDNINVNNRETSTWMLFNDKTLPILFTLYNNYAPYYINDDEFIDWANNFMANRVIVDGKNFGMYHNQPSHEQGRSEMIETKYEILEKDMRRYLEI